MKTLIGLLLGLAATAAWGSFYVAGRWLFGEEGDKLNTYLFNFLRFFMATLSLSGLLLIKSNREKFKQAIREDWKSFLLISLIGIVMESYLVFYALNFTTASRCSLMANFSPVATVILAYFLLGEKINKAGVIGMLTGFAGIILAGSSRGGDIYAGTSLRTLIGDGMALASGFCWAYFTVSGVKVSDKYGGALCMLIAFAFGTLLMSPVLFFVPAAEIAAIPPKVWGGMIYTGVITLAFANACWYGALRYLKAGMLGAFGYLSAAITFTLSILFLKEKFTLPFIIALILIVSGMSLMMNQNKSQEK